MTLVYPPGDFQGFLTAVLETWLHKAPDWTIVPDSGEWFLAEGPLRRVQPSYEAASRMSEGITNLAGREAWLALGQAFRYRGRDQEAVLVGFIRACVEHRRSTMTRLTDPSVAETIRRARAVQAEAHRYVGLLRFRAIAGGWYAPFEPDHDVLGLLVGHFHARMAGQDWVIHDLGRRKAWVCRDGNGEGITGVQLPAGWGKEPNDASVERLWKRYFDTIAIRERINPALQRSKMPQKTWKHLVEKG